MVSTDKFVWLLDLDIQLGVPSVQYFCTSSTSPFVEDIEELGNTNVLEGFEAEALTGILVLRFILLVSVCLEIFFCLKKSSFFTGEKNVLPAGFS